MNKPWVDPETGREHPPLVLDDEISYIPNAKPLLRGFRGNTENNQRLATDMRFAMEKGLIELPLSYRRASNSSLPSEDGKEKEGSGQDSGKPLTVQELAVYVEADALQIEMGNIVATITQAGNYSYGTARSTQKKDRYSSVAMANSYVTELENKHIRRRYQQSRDIVIGVVSYF